MTAKLIRLNSQFDPEKGSTAPDQGPGRLRSLLERTAASVTPSFEGEYFGDSVVAYQIPEEERDPDSQTTPGQTEHGESVARSQPEIEDGKDDQ
jgi:hypothetical protein